jgi:CubicO group peptidase (beta-lactamase class C family)
MIRSLAAILLMSATCLAQNAPAQNLQNRMDEIVQTFVANKQFMGAVLVARGDEVLLSKGYGSANLEWDIPNTSTTRFRLASVTKQFTAAAILILEERGKLKVEDTIKKHLPDAPAAWDKVTLFHLLTHTSGIPSAIGVPADPFRTAIATTADNVALVRDKPLDFEPGTNWRYSNSGYVLLGYLIERISGQTYEAFLRDNIFTPLGMKDSGYDWNSTVIARRASGYSPGPGGPVNSSFVDMSRPHAAGSLYSTVEDLLRWEQGLFGGKLLSQATVDKMTTPFRNNYAFGLQVRTAGTRKLIDHSGGIQGFNTMLAHYPESKVTIAVLGNLTGPAPAQITTLMARLAHGEDLKLLSERKEIPPLAPDMLARYVGTYRLPAGGTMLITVDGTQLYSRVGNQTLSLFPESDTAFFAKTNDIQFQFSGNDEQGRTTEIAQLQNGQTTIARRLTDAEAKSLAAAAAETAKRFREQTAAPGSESALRRTIEELRSGAVQYERMSAGLASTLRAQVAQLEETVKRGGAIQSVTLTSVTNSGVDIYHVTVQNGLWECRILLGADGKMEAFGIRAIGE